MFFLRIFLVKTLLNSLEGSAFHDCNHRLADQVIVVRDALKEAGWD